MINPTESAIILLHLNPGIYTILIWSPMKTKQISYKQKEQKTFKHKVLWCCPRGISLGFERFSFIAEPFLLFYRKMGVHNQSLDDSPTRRLYQCHSCKPLNVAVHPCDLLFRPEMSKDSLGTIHFWTNLCYFGVSSLVPRKFSFSLYVPDIYKILIIDHVVCGCNYFV